MNMSDRLVKWVTISIYLLVPVAVLAWFPLYGGFDLLSFESGAVVALVVVQIIHVLTRKQP